MKVWELQGRGQTLIYIKLTLTPPIRGKSRLKRRSRIRRGFIAQSSYWATRKSYVDYDSFIYYSDGDASPRMADSNRFELDSFSMEPPLCLKWQLLYCENSSPPERGSLVVSQREDYEFRKTAFLNIPFPSRNIILKEPFSQYISIFTPPPLLREPRL